MKPIRVAIVDDHDFVRLGLRTYLDLQTDLEVAGEATNGQEALSLVEKEHPQIVLMDLVMPGIGGIEAIRRIRDRYPDCRVIALTSFGDDESIFAALEAGAIGYLLKDVKPEELVQAIRSATLDEPQLHPEVLKKVMRRAVTPQKSPPDGPALDSLTGREIEVLGLLAQGLSNREIAQRLVIGEATVKTHVSNLLGKLQLADRTQAALFAHRHGLGAPPDE